MVHFCRTRMNGVVGPIGFLKVRSLNPSKLGTQQSPLVPLHTIPPRRMTHLTFQEPIISSPLMVDQGVFWTSPHPLEMTCS